ncbi:hypothetical protein EST38_g13843 [Candolleomyces aberdarensis]|uniref:Uncharacterized protein n=1 Tax=Candolleomyces aberdarensis TaxID=2316362 RepID=A0A4Q2CZZ8_9AGAR|nr:hypothetical protein EST38_g13843 [Candolleomyces aberdarensis]
MKNWLLNHFKWVAWMRVSEKADFNTALAFDIDMRTGYHRSPFIFLSERWYTEYIFFVQQQEKVRRDTQDELYRSCQYQGRSYLGRPSYCSDTSKGKKSLRPGQAGRKSGEKVPGCPICLTEGHRISDRKATKRADGKPLCAKITAEGKNLIASSVYSGTSLDARPRNASTTPTIPMPTDAPPAAVATTMPSPMPASRGTEVHPCSPTTGELLPPPLSPSISSTHPKILNHICTPYNADAFNKFFRRFPSLHEKYPHLTQKLREGFPMGTFPELKKMFIFDNRPLNEEKQKFLDNYSRDEVESGRMSGPYMKDVLEGIVGGPFQCSPIAIDKKPIDSTPNMKLRICINLSKGNKHHPSTNSYSDKEDFPTSYDLASYVADLVSAPFLTSLRWWLLDPTTLHLFDGRQLSIYQALAFYLINLTVGNSPSLPCQLDGGARPFLSRQLDKWELSLSTSALADPLSIADFLCPS